MLSPRVAIASLLAGELALCLLILRYARYTEIDWKAYMQEVQAVADGERDYTAIRANTGPLVYPAGFVWVYLGLHWLTVADPDCCRLPQTAVSESERCVSGGGDVRLAQGVYLAMYLVTLAVALRLYRACGVPTWAWLLCCASYRVHSLYLLRLFNDAPAMLLLYSYVLACASRRYALGGLLFSAALSLKMNALLFAPALALVTLRECGWAGAVARALPAIGLQVALAAPFLRANATGYLGRAFELSRAFEHRWSVNWSMLSPADFGSRPFALSLLACHLAMLVAFAHFRWCARDGGLPRMLAQALRGPLPRATAEVHAREVVGAALTCNFIGVACARSLHYQFYLYYFHALPVLLWRARLGRGWRADAARLALWLGMEAAYNVYPPTTASSTLLQLCHAAILLALWCARDAAPNEKPPSSGAHLD